MVSKVADLVVQFSLHLIYINSLVVTYTSDSSGCVN